jgi:hypothetical protein
MFWTTAVSTKKTRNARIRNSRVLKADIELAECFSSLNMSFIFIISRTKNNTTVTTRTVKEIGIKIDNTPVTAERDKKPMKKYPSSPNE